MANFEMDATKRYNNFVRMDHDMFKEMVDRLTPWIYKQDTNIRRALEPGFKLAITLRFLATGDSCMYVLLGYGFKVAPNNICSLVPEVVRQYMINMQARKNGNKS